MKKMLITVCVLSLVFVSVFGIRKIISEKEAQDAEKRYEENVIKANEQCKKMMEHMSTEFPDYYGGNYIDEDGHLVVCVTSDYDKNSNVFQEYTGNEEIIIRNVQYSYNMLSGERERIMDLCVEWYGKDVDINHVDSADVRDLVESVRQFYIEDAENSLVIEIHDLDEKKIKTFQAIFSDDEFIRLEKVHYWFVWTSLLDESIEMR